MFIEGEMEIIFLWGYCLSMKNIMMRITFSWKTETYSSKGKHFDLEPATLLPCEKVHQTLTRNGKPDIILHTAFQSIMVFKFGNMLL